MGESEKGHSAYREVIQRDTIWDFRSYRFWGPAGHKKLSVLKLSVLGSGRKKLSILVMFNQSM